MKSMQPALYAALRGLVASRLPVALLPGGRTSQLGGGSGLDSLAHRPAASHWIWDFAFSLR